MRRSRTPPVRVGRERQHDGHSGCGGVISSVSPSARPRWVARSPPSAGPGGLIDTFQRADVVDRHLADAWGTLATCYRSLGELEHAEVARRRQVGVLDAVAPGSVEWVDAAIELGDLCRFRASTTTPRRCSSAPSTSSTTELASDPMLKARALTALGIEYKDTGRYDEAARTYGEAFDLVTAATGSDHLSAASLWHNLAGLALARGCPAKQSAAAARAVQIRNANSDPATTSAPKTSPSSVPRSATKTESTKPNQHSNALCESLKPANLPTVTKSPSTSATSESAS